MDAAYSRRMEKVNMFSFQVWFLCKIQTLKLLCQLSLSASGNPGRPSEIYPLGKDQEHRLAGNMVNDNGTYGRTSYSRLVSFDGKTTRIFAIATGRWGDRHTSRRGTTRVGVWNPETETWSEAPSEYQLKKSRELFGVIAVPRDLVCASTTTSTTTS